MTESLLNVLQPLDADWVEAEIRMLEERGEHTESEIARLRTQVSNRVVSARAPAVEQPETSCWSTWS